MLDPNKIAMEAQLKNLRKELEPMFLMLPTIAEMNFKYYKGLLAQGFTEVQALELTKAHGMNFNPKSGRFKVIQLAKKSGVPRPIYAQRIKAGWDPKEAATKSVKPKYKGEFAVYRKDELVVMGTAEECAEALGVSVAYIRWMTTPTGKKRLARRKNPDMATTAVKLDG